MLTRDVVHSDPELMGGTLEEDWQAWDQQIERDSAEGCLDGVAAEALAEVERGETKEI